MKKKHALSRTLNSIHWKRASLSNPSHLLPTRGHHWTSWKTPTETSPVIFRQDKELSGARSIMVTTSTPLRLILQKEESSNLRHQRVRPETMKTSMSAAKVSLQRYSILHNAAPLLIGGRILFRSQPLGFFRALHFQRRKMILSYSILWPKLIQRSTMTWLWAVILGSPRIDTRPIWRRTHGRR